MKNCSPESEALAFALREILDHGSGPSRTDWAEYVEASPSALSQWCSGKNVPRAESLLAILLRCHQIGLEDAAAGIDSIAFRAGVFGAESEGGRRTGTLAEYLAKAVSAELSRAVLRSASKMKPSQQVALLRTATRLLEDVGVGRELTGIRMDQLCEAEVSRTPRRPPASAEWLEAHRGIPVSSYTEISRAFHNEFWENERHPQVLDRLSVSQPKYPRSVLAPVVILAAWNAEEISIHANAGNRLDMEETSDPAEILTRMEPLQLRLHYRRQRRTILNRTGTR